MVGEVKKSLRMAPNRTGFCICLTIGSRLPAPMGDCSMRPDCVAPGRPDCAVKTTPPHHQAMGKLPRKRDTGGLTDAAIQPVLRLVRKEWKAKRGRDGGLYAAVRAVRDLLRGTPTQAKPQSAISRSQRRLRRSPKSAERYLAIYLQNGLSGLRDHLWGGARHRAGSIPPEVEKVILQQFRRIPWPTVEQTRLYLSSDYGIAISAWGLRSWLRRRGVRLRSQKGKRRKPANK